MNLFKVLIKVMEKLTFSIYLFFNMCIGQEINLPTQSEINNLITKGNYFYKQGKHSEAYNSFDQALENSMKNGFSKEIVESAMGVSKASFALQDLDRSIKMLRIAGDQPYAKNNPDLQADIYFSLALNLHALNLKEEAVKKYRISLAYSSRIKDIELRNDKIIRNMINLGDMYQREKKYDSASFYYYKALKIPSGVPGVKLINTLYIADLYIIRNEKDSATKYIELSHKHSNEIHEKVYKIVYKRILGSYYHYTKNYNKAINEYRQAIKLNKQMNREDPLLYGLLARTFFEYNEPDSAEFYVQKHMHITKNDKFKALKDNEAVQNYFEYEKDMIIKKNKKKQWFIFVLSFILISITVFIAFKKNRKNVKHLNNNNKELSQEFYGELSQLAKEDSTTFFLKFQELSPDFYNKLIISYPNLTPTDLLMCAYLRFDFTTKEIAKYTFLSTRTIENRKYRLRKKFSIDSKSDINKWIRNL